MNPYLLICGIMFAGGAGIVIIILKHWWDTRE
jgi:hypothetical protein